MLGLCKKGREGTDRGEWGGGVVAGTEWADRGERNGVAGQRLGRAEDKAEGFVGARHCFGDICDVKCARISADCRDKMGLDH